MSTATQGEHLAPPVPPHGGPGVVALPSPNAAPPPLGDLPTLDGLPLYRLSIRQYEELGNRGVFDGNPDVVLIAGLLVAKMTKHPPHAIANDNLTALLVRALPDGWHVSNQNPVLLPLSDSAPEPDLKVVRGKANDYVLRHPGASDLALIIEVSDRTLRADQSRMKRIYAEAAVSAYWIVNLVARRIEVYTDPTGPDPTPDYRRREDFGPDDSIPLILDGREVTRLAVRDILPPNS